MPSGQSDWGGNSSLSTRRCRPQGSHLAGKSVNLPDQFVMLLLGRRRFHRFDIEAAVRFQFAAPNLVQVFEPLAMDDLDQFFLGQRFAFHCFRVDLAVAR